MTTDQGETNRQSVPAPLTARVEYFNNFRIYYKDFWSSYGNLINLLFYDVFLWVNWNHAIAILQSLKYNTTTSNIGIILSDQ